MLPGEKKVFSSIYQKKKHKKKELCIHKKYLKLLVFRRKCKMDTSLYSEAEKVAGISSALVFPGITIIQGKNSIEY